MYFIYIIKNPSYLFRKIELYKKRESKNRFSFNFYRKRIINSHLIGLSIRDSIPTFYLISEK